MDIRGDSVDRRRIPDGSLVWINPDQRARHDDVVLARCRDSDGDVGMIVKVWRRTAGRGSLYNHSSDPALASSRVECEEAEVIGPVVLVETVRAPE